MGTWGVPSTRSRRTPAPSEVAVPLATRSIVRVVKLIVSAPLASFVAET